jgi:hypothetical protein
VAKVRSIETQQERANHTDKARERAAFIDEERTQLAQDKRHSPNARVVPRRPHRHTVPTKQTQAVPSR